ncbi:MAG: hypothetical protein M1819_005964 [Sarea resinae]|nr:MAG: hypothetical protein M1819_005964 [Sarea resinae]
MAHNPNRETLLAQPRSHGASPSSPFGSLSVGSPIAEASVARDVDDDPEYDPEEPAEGGDEVDDENAMSSSPAVRIPSNHPSLGYSMTGSYHRASFMAAGARQTMIPTLELPATGYLTAEEREAAKNEERSLLRDNHIIPPKHPRRSSDGSKSMVDRVGRHFHLGSDKAKSASGEDSAIDTSNDAADEPSETSALLGNTQQPYGGHDTAENIERRWVEAVAAGKISTTWQREAKVLGRYSRSLVATFLLQYSLTVASIFTVGHLGKVELAAVSLASMTANITGYAIYQGLATSLDTLCAQAYGSGKRHLVGLQLQRMVYFLWVITIPVGIIWLSAGAILSKIVPEKELAHLAGRYLKVLLIGAPAYALFESAKRFVQAQGLFEANLYVLLFCAPLNAFMNWLFVWQFKWGFIGAPIAVVTTDILLPICLFLYVRFVAGMQCWGGFSRRAFVNWGPMIRLALPGLLMIEAEWLAFEVLTLAASYFSTTHLAAQSVLSTITAITFQIPFPVSVAASTRIANLIGATLSDAAKTASKVGTVAAFIVGVCNVILLSTLRHDIPRLFTSDPDVLARVAEVLPLCAAFQLFDALAANCNGILRGLGRQIVGGWVNLFCYYAVAMPISFGTAFGLRWELYGLWAGPALALGLVSLIEGIYITQINWEKSVDAAQKRNSQA